MKLFVLALFVATAFAVPVPLEDEDVGAVDVIVNGVPEGEPLELGDVLGIHVNEHVDGVLASSANVLHPYTAVGMAEAAAAEAAAAEVIASPDVAGKSLDVVIPEPVVLPSPVAPEVVMPQPIVLPAPAQPEVIAPVVPEPVVLPAPGQPEVVSPVVPEPVVLPAPSQPEVVIPETVESEVVQPETADVPVAAPQSPNGEVFNNGVVQVSVNTPQDAGVFSTLQSWVSFVLNYFNGETQTSHQII